MQISIVTSLYKTGNYLSEFYQRAKEAALRDFAEYEFVIVNDASPDDGLAQAQALREQDAQVKVIDLSRNFGHHAAIRCGLEHATGDYIFVLDSDLEEAPEWLNLFYAKLRENPQADVVYGVQEKRLGTPFRRWAGELFYKILGWLSEVDIPANSCCARIMTRRYLDSCLRLDDKVFTFDVWFAQAGYEQIPVLVEKPYKGESGYTFTRKLNLAIELIVGSSAKPLYLLSTLGVLITIPSFLYILWIIVRSLFSGGELISGWSSLFVSIWFFGGLILFALGFVGLYISKIFIESKDNPLFIVRDKWG